MSARRLLRPSLPLNLTTGRDHTRARVNERASGALTAWTGPGAPAGRALCCSSEQAARVHLRVQGRPARLLPQAAKPIAEAAPRLAGTDEHRHGAAPLAFVLPVG